MSAPATDEGTLPNLRFSFSDAHNRLEPGGWAREVTERELPVATTLAGVNMRLEPGAVRELHWHKQAEWAYMLWGGARITAVDSEGNGFVDDVEEGDLWYFPAGIPHSIQALATGCEFLLVFDDGAFSENATFLLSDWLAHTPREVLAKNFGVAEAAFADIPAEELYIFPESVPDDLTEARPAGVEPPPRPFSHRLSEQEPIVAAGGSVRIADSRSFPAARTIAAALVVLEPGAMRELHWHPNGDEWQYYIEGEGRMSAFAAAGKARTFDFRAGDVGYVPFAMGHYVENTGDGPLRFLEMFRSDRFEDVSLNQWLGLTPPRLVRAHLHVGEGMIEALERTKPVLTAAERS
ncbi:MAG TPA: oxalate decarboxylase family bicupin [Solirubrobacterales bacterium]|nr:oxalate decarboxylase family bicupin [Solirubrobacterales bacterium]